jgi:hypothetical protein
MDRKVVIVSNVIPFIHKHHTAITTTVELLGFGATVGLAIHETLKADAVIYSKESEKGEPLTKLEKVKAYGFLYWPTVLIGCATAGFIANSNVKYAKHIIALSDAVMLSQKAYSEYKDNVIKQIGEAKEKKIDDKGLQEKVSNITPEKLDDNNVIDTGNGDVLFLDEWSGMIFKSSRQSIDEAFIKLNNKIMKDDYVTLNNLYEFIEVPSTGSGQYMGWDLQNCYDTTGGSEMLINHDYSSTISADGRTPIMVLKYIPQPIEDWHNWY